MTGEIIDFQRQRDLKRGQLYSEQTRTTPRSCGPPRAGLEGTHRVLRLLLSSERRAALADDSEGDPQPEIDCEKLDRMYRDLNSDARCRQDSVLKAELLESGRPLL